MFFEDRPIQIRERDDVGELADSLINDSHCLCTGFRIGPILIINDSTCEDGAAEFAIVEPHPTDPTRGYQVNSVTFGWMSKEPETAVDIIIDAIHAANERQLALVHEPAITVAKAPANSPVTTILGIETPRNVVPINPHPEGYNSCELCA